MKSPFEQFQAGYEAGYFFKFNTSLRTQFMIAGFHAGTRQTERDYNQNADDASRAVKIYGGLLFVRTAFVQYVCSLATKNERYKVWNDEFDATIARKAKMFTGESARVEALKEVYTRFGVKDSKELEVVFTR